MLEMCGDVEVDLLSGVVKRFVDRMDPTMSAIVSSLLTVFNGATLKEWKGARTAVKLREFAASPSVSGISPTGSPVLPPSSSPSSFPPSLSLLHLPRLASTLLTLTSRLPYLADKRPEEVCAAAFEGGGEGGGEIVGGTEVERWTVEELDGREKETGV